MDIDKGTEVWHYPFDRVVIKELNKYGLIDK